MNDLHDLLSRRQGFQDLRTDGAFLDSCNKLFYDLLADIGLKKRHPDFFQGRLDIGFGKFSFPAEVAEYFLKFFGQAFKSHGTSLLLVFQKPAGDLSDLFRVTVDILPEKKLRKSPDLPDLLPALPEFPYKPELFLI